MNYGTFNLEFTFCWNSGRKNKNPATPFWHQPNIMDGGYYLLSTLDKATSTLYVRWCEDSFAGGKVLEEIKIPIERDTLYHIVVIDNKLSCKEGV